MGNMIIAGALKYSNLRLTSFAVLSLTQMLIRRNRWIRQEVMVFKE